MRTLLFLPLLAPLAAGADATLVLEGTGESPVITIQVRDGMARMQAVGSRDYMVYDSRRDLMFVVEPENGHYMEVDRDTLERAGRAMASQREMMKQQLARLPPEQRAQAMEEMGLDDSPVEVRPGATRKVAGIRCREHTVLRGGTRLGSACLASAHALGIGQADFRTLRRMQGMMRRLSALEGPGKTDPVLLVEGGVPVAGTDALSGDRFELQSLSTSRINAALFSDYTRYRRRRMAEELPPELQ